MNEELAEKVSDIDWKEVRITFITTLAAATLACAVVITVAEVVKPAILKWKEKRAASKDKDAKK